MATDVIRKLTSEPAVFFLISLSLVLIVTLFNEELGTQIFKIYGALLILDLIIHLLFPNIEVKSVSGNTATALLYAGIAFAGLYILYGVVQFMFRQSVLPVTATEQQLAQSVFQTVFQSFSTFSSQMVDFSKLTVVKYYLFGFLIPIQETRAIGRIYGAVAQIANVQIGNFRNIKNWSIIILVSILFMYFHLKVRGVNNNIDLAMTFLFALVSLFIIGKFREVESANYLHIGWNSFALFLGR